MSVLFTNEMAQKILDAINTLNSNLVNARGGALSNLSTSTKESIIAAINELVTGQGSLSSLSTTVKTSLVAAVNELLNQRGGALSNLSTNSKISIIAAINELVTGQGTLSSLSTSAKNNLVAAINELVNADATINTKLDRIYTNNAAAHNAVYRGKNLGTSITDAQLSAIRNGTFDDLYIGDYWTLPVDGGTTALIVGCNCYCFTWSEDAINLPGNNLCVWLRNNNWKFPMNDTDTCAGHLKGSKLYNETFPALVAKLEAVLPSGCLRESTHRIADSINSSGIRNHSVIDKMKLFLPSRHNLALQFGYSYGAGVSSYNSAYDGPNQIMWPYSLFNKTPVWAFFWMDAPFSATEWNISFDARWIDAMYAKASIAPTVWPYCYIG